MRKIGRDIERDAMEGDPASDADAERGDLVLRRRPIKPGGLIRPRDPDADAILARLARHAEKTKRVDQPGFESADKGAHIRPSALQIKHHISDALAGPMIGELAAAPRAENRKARVDEIALLRARAGGVERRMFEKPHAFGRLASGDLFDARLHGGDGVIVRDEAGRREPFDGRRAGCRQKRRSKGGARKGQAKSSERIPPLWRRALEA